MALGERIGKYEKKGLYEIIFDLSGQVYDSKIRSLNYQDRVEYLFGLFNEKLQECYPQGDFLGIEINDNNIFGIPGNLFDGLFLSEEDASLGFRLVEKFNDSYSDLRKVTSEKKRKYLRQNEIINYLDSYLDLCRFVFKNECLKQEELRSLEIIEKLLNIDYNKDKQAIGIYSPFVLFALLRTLHYIASLPEHRKNDVKLPQQYTKMLDSRGHIVATHAIRSFSRFTTIKGKSYVVEYSRRRDKIICKEAEKVSSIDNIKPIRLFEKITSYIYNYFQSNSSLEGKDFKVSVYGFCSYELNGGFNPIEIDDLVYEIFSWFEDKRKIDPILNNKEINSLQLDYYIVKDVECETTFSCDYEYHSEKENGLEKIYQCKFNVTEDNYEAYNNRHLAETLRQSDLMFVLDCPWLATDDFTLANGGDLKSYSQWVNHNTYKNEFDISQPHLKNNEVFFNRSNMFSSINDQFNRLAVSSVAKYGRIVRVMKDYMLNWIQTQIRQSREMGEYKTVYLYNSSLRGMPFSDYADYPIIREESYSNKRFSIMRFSTRENHSVLLNRENKIYISLWNLVKYVDISFVYVGLKEFFVTNLHEFISEITLTKSKEEKEAVIQRDIISIMRNIVFVVCYPQNEYGQIEEVNIDIALSEPVRKAYCSCENKDNVNILITFFEKIITDVIFKNTIGLGDDCIRDAFERCLYNQAKAVNDIYFLHEYSKSRINNSLSKFKVNVNCEKLAEPNKAVNALVPNFDAFSDKRAYKKLLEYFDMPKCPEFSIISVLNQVDCIFGDSEDKSHSDEILGNIKKICELFGYTNSFLYENLNRFL